MNIVVIGLGSMGKRRIRLLRDMYPDFVIYGVDGRDDRREEASEQYGIDTFATLTDITADVDCVFVCTSPLSHAGIIEECLKNSWNVFTELNLIDDRYEENLALARKNNCILFLSSTFFYREEIRYIKSRITDDKQWNYIYHVGQYLPDWHPWENYKDFFVGDKRTNGCREILAIELPWLTSTFGAVDKIEVLSDRITRLNIGFDDNYMIQIKHNNGNKGSLIVDVVSPCAVRKLEAYTEGRYLSWNGTPDSIFEFDPENRNLALVVLNEEAEHRQGYTSFIVENAYRNEIREFFDVVLNGKKTEYGFEQDRETLKLIDIIGA